ncbi:MAG: hypothetical protein SFY69_10885 [Planctomycetota bacterium]|nr:hypothetical protein [Planctomycetota bacterium]
MKSRWIPLAACAALVMVAGTPISRADDDKNKNPRAKMVERARQQAPRAEQPRPAPRVEAPRAAPAPRAEPPRAEPSRPAPSSNPRARMIERAGPTPPPRSDDRRAAPAPGPRAPQAAPAPQAPRARTPQVGPAPRSSSSVPGGYVAPPNPRQRMLERTGPQPRTSPPPMQSSTPSDLSGPDRAPTRPATPPPSDLKMDRSTVGRGTVERAPTNPRFRMMDRARDSASNADAPRVAPPSTFTGPDGVVKNVPQNRPPAEVVRTDPSTRTGPARRIFTPIDRAATRPAEKAEPNAVEVVSRERTPSTRTAPESFTYASTHPRARMVERSVAVAAQTPERLHDGRGHDSYRGHHSERHWDHHDDHRGYGHGHGSYAHYRHSRGYRHWEDDCDWIRPRSSGWGISIGFGSAGWGVSVGYSSGWSHWYRDPWCDPWYTTVSYRSHWYGHRYHYAPCPPSWRSWHRCGFDPCGAWCTPVVICRPVSYCAVIPAVPAYSAWCEPAVPWYDAGSVYSASLGAEAIYTASAAPGVSTYLDIPVADDSGTQWRDLPSDWFEPVPAPALADERVAPPAADAPRASVVYRASSRGGVLDWSDTPVRVIETIRGSTLGERAAVAGRYLGKSVAGAWELVLERAESDASGGQVLYCRARGRSEAPSPVVVLLLSEPTRPLAPGSIIAVTGVLSELSVEDAPEGVLVLDGVRVAD